MTNRNHAEEKGFCQLKKAEGCVVNEVMIYEAQGILKDIIIHLGTYIPVDNGIEPAYFLSATLQTAGFCVTNVTSEVGSQL